ncbi:actin cytoskeletal 2a [Anaeramoeba ignava]|uniref:Actin cytoskeletal 2a n=1 Tax=Anaeramoeba ignava TaxID=1746090 RepID=A0A9Q0LVV2_ANAIG|nr:actin cytoskeletal 2a [Anaeramoeba ignava]
MEENTPIVIDNGAFKIKAGFAGDDAPRSIFRTIVLPEYKYSTQPQNFIGDSTLNKMNQNILVSPMIENGEILDWDQMQAIWNHIFSYELRVDPTQRPICISQQPFASQKQKQKIAEIFFEVFKIPAISIPIGSVLSIMGTGRTTALAVEIGHDLSYCYATYEGYHPRKSLIQLPITGSIIDQLLTVHLQRNGFYANSFADQEIIREIKESHCYISQNFTQELRNPKQHNFKTSNNQQFSLISELFVSTESFFNPNLVNLSGLSFQQLINKAIMKCGMDARKDLFSNIVLIGGSSMFPGLADRLRSEIAPLAPPKATVQVSASPERKLLEWIGGSIFASLSLFSSQILTRQQFEENPNHNF